MKEMTSLERVKAVLSNTMPDRLPVVPQGFIFSAHTAGYNIGAINRNPVKMAKSHCISQEKYGYDGCIIDLDDAALAEACGATAIFRDDNVACVDEHHPAVTNLREVADLKIPDPHKDGRLPEWLETTSRVVEAIGKHVFVIGRADQGPFTLLSLLRGTQQFMMDLITEEEDVIFDALEWATKVHITFAKAQMETGAHAASMGDAYASPNLVSPKMYRKFALPYEKQVVKTLLPYNKPYSIHICGDTNSIIEDMGTTGAKILEVDWKLDMGVARRLVPEDTILMGNINPSDPMCLGTPEKVLSQCQGIIAATSGKGLILSSGCALGANTLPENMEALVNAAKYYGTYEQLMELKEKTSFGGSW